MKKILMLLAVLGVMAVFAAEGEWKWPGWQGDVAGYQEAIDTAQEAHQLHTATYMLAIAQNPPASFESAKATITTALQALDCEEARIIRSVKQYCYVTRKFLPEVIAFARLNPCPYDYYLAMRDDTDWGYTGLVDSLTKKKFSPAEVMQGINALNKLAIELDKEDAEVYADLKKLNRVYSALLTSEVGYEKVVAQIRTLMETFD